MPTYASTLSSTKTTLFYSIIFQETKVDWSLFIKMCDFEINYHEIQSKVAQMKRKVSQAGITYQGKNKIELA